MLGPGISSRAHFELYVYAYVFHYNCYAHTQLLGNSPHKSYDVIRHLAMGSASPNHTVSNQDEAQNPLSR